jgi:hypothetical protein
MIEPASVPLETLTAADSLQLPRPPGENQFANIGP